MITKLYQSLIEQLENSKAGSCLVEYVLVLSLVAVVILAIFHLMGTQLARMFGGEGS